jgi:hypothetical protein
MKDNLKCRRWLWRVFPITQLEYDTVQYGYFRYFLWWIFFRKIHSISPAIIAISIVIQCNYNKLPYDKQLFELSIHQLIFNSYFINMYISSTKYGIYKNMYNSSTSENLWNRKHRRNCQFVEEILNNLDSDIFILFFHFLCYESTQFGMATLITREDQNRHLALLCSTRNCIQYPPPPPIRTGRLGDVGLFRQHVSLRRRGGRWILWTPTSKCRSFLLLQTFTTVLHFLVFSTSKSAGNFWIALRNMLSMYCSWRDNQQRVDRGSMQMV